MTVSQSALTKHLSNDLLVRSMDEELSGSEIVLVERHLTSCEECQMRQTDLRRVSNGLESFFHSLQPEYSLDERKVLLSKLESSKQKTQVYGTGQTLARFGWVLAAAATLAVSISYVPFARMFIPKVGDSSLAAPVRSAQTASAFEIDGETFQYLPYSNPDLPLGASHVVQMQVPLSSLADAGLLVEPTANRMTMPDHAVLANVLLGMDGQPIGVHVLSAD